MRTVTAESEPGKELERRPEARPFSVEALVHDVLEGRVRVPKFQRPLLWTAEDAKELLDSIYRGYPIGTLLFWQRQADAQRLEYGTVIVDARPLTEALWVVDGQQRIHALVRSLAGAGFPDEKFALFFDLENANFAHAQRPEDVKSNWLPLTEIVDSERLVEWILNHPNVDRRAAIRVGKRIREYQIPAYLFRTDDEDAVRLIFSRLNRRGKQMADHDVFKALYGAKRRASPSDVHEVARELASQGAGFGLISSKLLHSMMLATMGTDVSKNRVPKLSDGDAQAALTGLSRSARLVIQFLQNDAAIPHVELLPYSQPLMTLTRFFYHHPEPHPRSRKLLARWVWRGAVSGQHQGSTMSVRKTLEAVDGDEHASVQRLLGILPKHFETALPLDGFRFRDARAKIQVLALWSSRPRNLQTGEKLDVHSESLFPPAIITSSLPEGHLANRMIHPEIAGSRVLRTALLEVSERRILDSHVLNVECIASLRERKYDEFERLRGELLRPVVERFIEERTQPRGSDRPPLLALVVPDGEDDHGS